jgi:DNA repair exonuclease SbcCD nuclease subunit
MTRVIHTGDTHLGYQQYHLPQRREDFLQAFRQVVADAVEEDVDAVVHAGDLFHDRRPTLPDIMGALSVLRELDDAGIPFLAVVGNHESKRDAQWLDLFESLGLATRLGDEPVTVGNVAVYGLDFVARAEREDLEYDFPAHDRDYAALVSHGLFQPFEHGDWDLREVLAGSSVRFDAALLGDDHTPQTRRVEDPHDAWLTYCGSTERASAEERETRGYNLVVFEDDPPDPPADGVDIRRRALETREFVFVDVELGPGEGVERVRERVTQEDLTDAVVVVSISGEGEPVTPAAVEEAAADAGALTTRVTDRRDLADERDVEVSFADPDEAVRERVRELGLSPAARGVDETVRASKVADSNVAGEVERRVRELLEDGETDAFRPAEDEETEDAGSGAAASSEDGDAEADPESGADDQETDRPGTGEQGAGEQGTGEGDAETGDGETDSQVTMEDYL